MDPKYVETHAMISIIVSFRARRFQITIDNFENVGEEQFPEEPIPEPNPVVEPEPVQPAPAPEVHDANELLETGNAEGKEDVFSHYWHPEIY